MERQIQTYTPSIYNAHVQLQLIDIYVVFDISVLRECLVLTRLSSYVVPGARTCLKQLLQPNTAEI